MKDTPPPIIDSAKLICFAINDDEVDYTDRIDLHVSNSEGEFERIGELPNLAISKTYGAESDYLLMLCDAQWVVKGVIAFAGIEEAKTKAERGYKGITRKWVNSPYSHVEIDDFLRDEYGVDPRSEWWTTMCSFCGKKDSEVEEVLVGKYASICKSCVLSFYEAFNENA